MKKKLLAALLLVPLLLALCACGGRPLPEGMEEGALLDAGREVVTQLNGGDWQGVYDKLRADGRETTSPEAIQAYMEDILDKAGAYVSETGSLATGQTLKATGEKYGTAVLTGRHEKANVLYRIAFSADMELMGLEVKAK